MIKNNSSQTSFYVFKPDGLILSILIQVYPTGWVLLSSFDEESSQRNQENLNASTPLTTVWPARFSGLRAFIVGIIFIIISIQAFGQVNSDVLLQRNGGIKSFGDLGTSCPDGTTNCFSEPCGNYYVEKGYSCASNAYIFISQLGNCSLASSTATGITFNPSSVGTYTVKEVTRNINRVDIGGGFCGPSPQPWTEEATFTVSVEQMEWSVGSFSRCENDADINLSSFMSVNGVSYSGSCGECVSGSSFQSDVAGPGMHTVTATKSYGNGTVNLVLGIEVFATTVLTFGGIPDVCVDAPNINLSNYTTPVSGGTFSGSGVVGNEFDPSNAGTGTHTLTYTFINGDNCTTSTSTEVHVANIFTVNAGPNLSRCMNDEDIDLVEVGGFTPSGGTFSGTYVSGNVFDIGAAGIGTHTVTYTKNQDGCELSDTKTITINGLPTVEADGSIVGCEDVGLVAMNTAGVSPGGGIWSSGNAEVNSAINNSTGQINLSAVTPGSYTLTYTYTNLQGCTDADVRDLIVNGLPGVAGLTVLGDARCGAGVVSLSASHTTTSHSFEWYANASGGSPLSSSSSYSPDISATTSYWVEIVTSVGCRSAVRTQVTGTVYPVPSAPLADDIENCGPGSVTMNASGGITGALYHWYNNSTGGSPLFTGSIFSTSVSSTRSFYVEAVSPDGCKSPSRTEVIVTINVVPGPSTVIHDSNCGPGMVNLNVGGAPMGGDYRWYTNEVGGSMFNIQSSYEVFLSETTSFWVSIVTAEGCEGPRAEIVGTIEEAPPTPIGNSAERCGMGQVTLVANGVIGATFDWYETAFSQVSIFEGASFMTPNISETTSYWVDLTDAMGCTSGRTGIIATIHPIPQDPTAPNVEHCGPGQVTLTASGNSEGANFEWYENSIGGSIIFEGGIFEPFVSTTRSYYVRAKSNEGCISELRTEVVVTIHPIPSEPIVGEGNICGEGVTILTAGGASEGGSYHWYETEGSVELLATGNEFVTQELQNTRSYFVSIVNQFGCEGSRSEVVAIVNPIPERPVVEDEKRCGEGNITLEASSTEVNGSINWYLSDSGGQPFSNGPTLTLNADESVVYYASVESEAECESTREAVHVTVEEIVKVDIGEDLTLCINGGSYDLKQDLPPGVEAGDGIFSGSGIINGVFFPGIADVGTHIVEFILTSSIGCLTNGTRVVTVMDVTEGGDDLTLPSSELNLCLNAGSYDLSGLPSIQGGEWQGEGITLDIFDPLEVGIGENEVTYVVDLNGCLAKASVVIIVLAVPEVPEIVGGGEGMEVCEGEAVELEVANGLPGTVYHWYLAGEEEEGDAFEIGKKVSVSPLDRTVYAVQAENVFGCLSGFAEVVVDVRVIEVDFTVSEEDVPFGGRVDFESVIEEGEENYEYFWDFGDGLASERANPSHYYYDEGVFDISVTLQDDVGCEKTVLKEDLIRVGGNLLDLVVGIKNNVSNSKVNVYPLPFDEYLEIDIHSSRRTECSFTIQGLDGKVLLRKEVVLDLGENKIRIDNSEFGLDQGMYLLRFEGEGISKVFRVVNK